MKEGEKMKKNLMVIVALLLTAAMLAGCSGTSANAPAASAGDEGTQAVSAANPDDVYYMVTFSSGIEYWKGCYNGFESVAAKYGAKTEYTGANTNDVNQEVTVLEQVIAKNPAGIAVTCVNPEGLKDPIQKAIDQGIPVVTFDSDSPDSGRYSFLATGHYAAGVEAAKAIAELCGEQGEVGILQVPGLLNLEERANGFKETIEANYPNMKVVQTVNGNLDQAEGAKVTAGMLQANPNMKGIFCTDSTAGVGAGTAVKEAGKEGAIQVVSFDTDSATLDMIKEGTIQATIAQGTYNMGFWSFEFLYDLHNNHANPVEGWKEKGISPLPTTVDTGVSIVTKDNADSFYMEK